MTVWREKELVLLGHQDAAFVIESGQHRLGKEEHVLLWQSEEVMLLHEALGRSSFWTEVITYHGIAQSYRFDAARSLRP